MNPTVPLQEIFLLTVVNVSGASNIRAFDPAQLSKGLPLIPVLVGKSIHAALNDQKHQMNGKWIIGNLPLNPYRPELAHFSPTTTTQPNA